MINKFTKMYRKIIEPYSEIQNPIDHLKAQILSRITLLMPLISLFFMQLFSIYIDKSLERSLRYLAILLFMSSINTVILIIYKTSYYKSGWFLLLLNIVINIHITSYPYTGIFITRLLFLIVPVILSVMLFDFKVSIINTLIIVNTIPLLYLFDLDIKSDEILNIYLMVLIFGLTIIIFLSRITHEIQNYQTKYILEKEELFAHTLKMEAIGRLASGVAHDFNNILTIISGYASLLDQSINDRDNTETLKIAVDEILIGAKRAENITRQLLTFSKKSVTQLEAFEINQLIIENSNFINMLINKTNINHTQSLMADTCQILMDKNQLQQVLINLISNATEAMENEGLLHISTKILDRIPKNFNDIYDFTASNYVLLTISDTGVGIKETHLGSIYDPYFTTKETGIGLGLFTVYKIIGSANGAIKIKSQVNKGTDVYIILPITIDLTNEKLKMKIKTELPADRIFKILIVDDETQIVNIIKKSLSSNHFEIFTANTPFEALDIINTSDISIDLVISDIAMPDMSGMELLEKITLNHPRTRFLLISGYARDSFFGSRQLDQEIQFIQKPFTLDNLRNRVYELLSIQSMS